LCLQQAAIGTTDSEPRDAVAPKVRRLGADEPPEVIGL